MQRRLDDAAGGMAGLGVATTAAMGAAAAGSLFELLNAAETADVERTGLLYGSQLLTCCRLQGIEESSALLRHMIDACQEQGPDGRVHYVKFVQQLAAHRAGQSARDAVISADEQRTTG